MIQLTITLIEHGISILAEK